MAVGFAVTRLLFGLMCGINCKVFSTAESIVPEEVAQKAYRYLNEKLPLYINQKQPELAELLGQLLKIPNQQTKSPIQQASFNAQSYIPHLLNLAKLGSVIAGSSDWAKDGKHGADSSHKPKRFWTQNWIGSTPFSNQKQIPIDSQRQKHTHDAKPHFRLSVNFPDPEDFDQKIYSPDKMELVNESPETELNKPVLLHKPEHHDSGGPHHPILMHHNPQDYKIHNKHPQHYQRDGLEHQWSYFPFLPAFGYHGHHPGHHDTSQHIPRSSSRWPIPHDSERLGTLHTQPKSPPQWRIPYGPRNHGTVHHRPQNLPQWRTPNRGPVHHSTLHRRPPAQPQWHIPQRGPGQHVVPYHKLQTSPHWLIANAQ